MTQTKGKCEQTGRKTKANLNSGIQRTGIQRTK